MDINEFSLDIEEMKNTFFASPLIFLNDDILFARIQMTVFINFSYLEDTAYPPTMLVK